MGQNIKSITLEFQDGSTRKLNNGVVSTINGEHGECYVCVRYIDIEQHIDVLNKTVEKLQKAVEDEKKSMSKIGEFEKFLNDLDSVKFESFLDELLAIAEKLKK